MKSRNTPRKVQKKHSPSKRTGGDRVSMDVSCLFKETRPLEQFLKSRVVGQDDAIDTLICSYSRLLSGLQDPSRPLLTALLLGPTGVGKTETAKALAHTLFGSEMAMTRVNCEEYAHGHELSKLLGSPPGYVGYNIEPLLSQRRIDEPHRKIREGPQGNSDQGNSLIDRIFTSDENKFLSVLLFDEVEKAHPILWNTMLGILDSGMLTLGDNTTTDFSRSIILMTSNVGSRQMNEILDCQTIGFHQDGDSAQVEATSVRETALKAARDAFPLEFLNRVDEILVYSVLEREHLEKIFDKFLADFHERAINQAGVPILIKVDQNARNLIIDRGIDRRYGARPLRRAMERELVDPISRLMASQELHPGDVVEVEREGEHLVFYRKQRYSEALVV